MASSTAFKNMAMTDIFHINTQRQLPRQLFLAVTRRNPGSNDMQEPAIGAGSYARVPITANLFLATDAANGGVVENQTEIQFIESTASWGVVRYWAVFGALNGGEPLMWGEILNKHGEPEPRHIETSTILRVTPSQLRFALHDKVGG